MSVRTFTADEDAYLVAHYSTTTLRAMAQTLDRSWTVVQQRINRLIRAGQLTRRQRAYQPPWTEDELEYLHAAWGLKSEAVVARKLGRTPLACRLKAKRLGLTKKQAFYTGREVARIFGVDDKAAARWIAHGWLKGKKSLVQQGPHRCWLITDAALGAFIREHPTRYDYTRMTRPEHRYWRNLAEEVARAVGIIPPPHRAAQRWTSADDARLCADWGQAPIARLAAELERTPVALKHRAMRLGIYRTDAFYTTGEAARRLGVSVGQIYGWIADGTLPAQKGAVGDPAKPFWQIAPAAVERLRQQDRQAA